MIVIDQDVVCFDHLNRLQGKHFYYRKDYKFYHPLAWRMNHFLPATAERILVYVRTDSLFIYTWRRDQQTTSRSQIHCSFN